MFHIRFRSFHGVTSQIAIGAVPDGPLSETWQQLCDDNNGAVACSAEFLRALRTHAPHVAARVDESAFRIHRPEDLLRGRILPVVRQAWTRVEERVVMAVGDAWVLNDPVVGQGANLASRAAFVLGAAIAAGGPYDEAFAQRTEAAMWSQAEAPTTLTNAFLEPVPPHVFDLLVRASTDRDLGHRIMRRVRPSRGHVGHAHPTQLYGPSLLNAARSVAGEGRSTSATDLPTSLSATRPADQLDAYTL